MQTILTLNTLFSVLVIFFCVIKLSVMSHKTGQHGIAAALILFVVVALWSLFWKEGQTSVAELIGQGSLLFALVIYTRSVWYPILYGERRAHLRGPAAMRNVGEDTGGYPHGD